MLRIKQQHVSPTKNLACQVFRAATDSSNVGQQFSKIDIQQVGCMCVLVDVSSSVPKLKRITPACQYMMEPA
jgi:hypothetical protein